MEGQSKVHTWELLLRVEVRAARDDPPAILVGVDVPHVVAGVQDGLRVSLLHEGHFEIGRLPFKVFPDFLDLLFGSFQHDGLPRSGRRTALQSVYESINERPMSLSFQNPARRRGICRTMRADRSGYRPIVKAGPP